jgi:hypothetical protein
MNDPTHANRRTALKTMTTTLVGGGLLAGTASGTPGPLGEARGRREVVEIATEHDHETGEHRFELSTHEADAGWTTFELDNSTEHVHFAYFAKLPAQALTDAEAMGLTPLELYVESVTRPFQFFWDGLVPGKEPDPADDTDLYDSLFPPWFGEVQFYGGPGLTAAETESTTTVALDPGEYVVECYVKDANEDFHSYRGMIERFSVGDEVSGVPEPASTLDVTVSTDGLGAPGSVRPGRHVVAVEFGDQVGYANLVGHDVHLLRLEEGTSVADVNDWMNWAEPGQFVSDGHEPAPFLGGVSDIWTADLPRTGYFHVTLTPGTYVWVAEVPDPASKGLLAEFRVPGDRGRRGRRSR